jgi:hypothetical protein
MIWKGFADKPINQRPIQCNPLLSVDSFFYSVNIVCKIFPTENDILFSLSQIHDLEQGFADKPINRRSDTL